MGTVNDAVVAPAAKLTGLNGAVEVDASARGRPRLGLHLHRDAARHAPVRFRRDRGVAGALG